MIQASKKNFAAFLAAAVVMVGVASVASAQAIKMSGGIAVGAGYLTQESQATPKSDSLAGMEVVGDASINFSAQKGAFEVQVELGVSEDPGQALDTARHELRWNIDKAKAVEISSHSFGIEAVRGNVSVVNAPGGPVGDEEVNIDFADAGVANFEMNLGSMVIGGAISDACVPECGYGADADGNMVSGDIGQQSQVAHIRGGDKNLSYNGYYAMSSGVFSVSGDSGSSTAMGGGFSMETGGMTIGGDYASYTIGCVKALGCGDDIAITSIGASLMTKGMGGHFVKHSVDGGAETTNIDLVYLMEKGPVTMGPEYRQTTTSIDTGFDTVDVVDSFIVFGMSMDF